MDTLKTYGVLKDASAAQEREPWLACALEELDRVGFTVLTGQLDDAQVEDLRGRLDALLARQTDRSGGEEALSRIDEANQVRALCVEDAAFWQLATLPQVDKVVEAVLGPAAILLQQNGIVMPPAASKHNQQRWHRDLPYQRWISSAPLALGALCALDAFHPASGATAFLPASHRFAEFPSPAFVQRWEHVIEAPAGSVVLFDAMTYHRGGLNAGVAPRRAINTLYGSPLLAQQIQIDPPPGADERILRLSGVAYRTAVSVDAYRERRSLQRTKRS